MITFQPVFYRSAMINVVNEQVKVAEETLKGGFFFKKKSLHIYKVPVNTEIYFILKRDVSFNLEGNFFIILVVAY